MTTIRLRSTTLQPPRLRAHAPLSLESSPGVRLRRRLVLAALAALALAAARALGGCMTADICEDKCMVRQAKPHTTEQYTACADVCRDEETVDGEEVVAPEEGGEGEP